jgi:hypothetical protein
MQRLIERTGARVQPTTRLLRYVLPDRVSMRGSIAQGDEDVKGQIGQRPAMKYVIVCHALF